jgi:hypothetical protein
MPNHLHYGDNLEVLRRLPAESVDLIYLDPPFKLDGPRALLLEIPSKSGECCAAIGAWQVQDQLGWLDSED